LGLIALCGLAVEPSCTEGLVLLGAVGAGVVVVAAVVFAAGRLFGSCDACVGGELLASCVGVFDFAELFGCAELFDWAELLDWAELFDWTVLLCRG
jgi:hypothetical protein